MKYNKLLKELHTTSNNKSEARELARLAEELGNVLPHQLPRSSKKRIAQEIGIANVIQVPRYALASASGFAVILVIFLAQSALPGSILYPVKRGGEQVRSVVEPDYEETIVEIRKNEVEQLKQEAAPVEKVEKAEQEYQKTQEKVETRRRERQRSNDGQIETENQNDSSRKRWNERNRFRNDDAEVESNFEVWRR